MDHLNSLKNITKTKNLKVKTLILIWSARPSRKEFNGNHYDLHCKQEIVVDCVWEREIKSRNIINMIRA